MKKLKIREMHRQSLKQKILCFLILTLSIFALVGCNNDSNSKNNSIQTSQERNNEYGNSMANLQNNGIIASDGENIYYNNSKGLFMNSLEGGESRSISPHYAEQINVMGDWVYYYTKSSSGKDKGLWKVKKDGKELTQLRADGIDNLIVTNDWIYFTEKVNPNSDYPSLVKMDMVDNLIQPEHIYEGRTEHLNLVDDWFYFYSSREGGICKITIDGENFKKILSIDDEDNISYMVVENEMIYYVLNDTLYYMDIEGNSNKKIISLNSDITTSPFNSFIKAGDYIYITSWDNLYRLDIEKQELNQINCKLISSKQSEYGNTLYFSPINMIGDKLYFIQEDDDFDIGIYKQNLENNEFRVFE